MVKLTKTQKAWIKSYKDLTTFEAMHIDEVKAGEMTFEELVDSNVKWFEDWSTDMHLKVTQLPTTDEEAAFVPAL
jgi:hypothetical protein